MAYRDVAAARAAFVVFIPILVAHIGLLVLWNIADRLLAALILMAVATAGLFLAERRLRREKRVPLAAIVIGAAIVRLLLVPLPPTLSDDVHRYLWDGRVAAAGHNPYLRPPDDPLLASLRDEAWPELPHREVETVYPPLAVSIFAVAARFPRPIVILKAILLAADLIVIVLLARLADRRDLDRGRMLWYAWNPLVSLEVTGMAHVDVVGVAAVVTTVALLTSPRGTASGAGVAAAAAVLAKLVPIVAWPAWMRHSRRRMVFIAVCGVLVTTAFLPIVLASRGIPPGYIRFGISWEFNGPLFEPLWRLLERLDAPRAVAVTLDAVKNATSMHGVLGPLYGLNYPQFLAKALLALLAIPFFVRAWRDEDVGSATGRSFGALVVFSATVYPWYLLWVLPWAALGRWRPWLLLAALMPLSYLPQFGGPALFPWIWAAVWLPFFVLLALERR